MERERILDIIGNCMAAISEYTQPELLVILTHLEDAYQIDDFTREHLLAVLNCIKQAESLDIKESDKKILRDSKSELEKIIY